jgi:hypothetical protein
MIGGLEMIALALAWGLVGPAALPLRPQAACRGELAQAAGDPASLMRPQDWSSARPRKLGDLPDAKHEYAVLRMVDGCMVPAPVGYHPPPAK